MVLWDIEKKEQTCLLNILLKDYLSLLPIVRKTKPGVVILKRVGLPFFIAFMRKKSVFFSGLMIAVAFWVASSLFVWNIRIEGNLEVSTDVMKNFLMEEGIRIGIPKSKVDIEQLEKALRNTFPQIVWTSARMDGTSLSIFIKENETGEFRLEEPFMEDTAFDIVSDCEGMIVSMIVRSGVPRVKVGDTIKEDMVLVEGKIPIYQEDGSIREYMLVRSDADILVERQRQFSARVPFQYLKQVYTGREKQSYALRIGEKVYFDRLEDAFFVQEQIVTQRRPEVFESLSIPIYFLTRTQREYQNVLETHTEEEAGTLLAEKLSLFLNGLEEKGVQIIQKDVRIETSMDAWVLYGTFLVREQITGFKIGESNNR
jgi:similar to stage IV sporulation protein